MKDLRDWYSYLDRAAKRKPASDSSAVVPPPLVALSRVPRAPEPQAPAALTGASPAPSTPRAGSKRRSLRQGSGQAAKTLRLQQALPIDLGPVRARRVGRKPLTESREEIIQRLLDPELTLHEAAAILNLSKATLRRYTDQGKLACRRTAGGQRRFKLSDVLALLEHSPR